jgi:nicotinamide-nucleotide amidase
VPRKGHEQPCRLAALPGVPSEMKRMFVYEVLPRLPGTGNVIRRARVNAFGMGESDVEHLLGDLTARGRDPEIGITVHEATITLRIEAHGQSEAECERKIVEAKRQIRERLGELVFGEEDEQLEHVVIRLLRERGKTLATAESGTGGLLADRLTDVDGYDAAYRGGLIATTAAIKQELLDVDPALIEREGAISAAVTRAMAAGCRERFGSDYALAVTEAPPHNPDDTAAMAPVTWIALAGPEGAEAHKHVLIGDPAITKSRAAKTALNLLRLRLLRESVSV